MDSLLDGQQWLLLISLVCLVLVCSASVATQPKASMAIALIWVMVFSQMPIASAQSTAPTVATVAEEFPTIEQVLNGVPVKLPDWSKITFDSMNPFSENGSFQVPSEVAADLGFDKVAWEAGQKIADVLPMGALSGCLGIENLTMGNIQNIVQNAGKQLAPGISNLSQLGLKDFLPVQLQNLQSLTQAVPGLGGIKIGDILPVADLIGSKFDLNSLANLAGMSGVGDVMNTVGQVQNTVGQVQNVVGTAGQMLGQVRNGQVLDATGNLLGTINPQTGQVTDPTGSLIGQINQTTGQVTNAAGQVLGTLNQLQSGQLPMNLLQMPLQQALSQIPGLNSLSFQGFDLAKYGFSQIPGLENAKLGDFMDWQKVLMKGIPGFAQIPFNQFPNPLAEGQDPFVARVDVPLDGQEQDRERSVSGSYQAGFRVACDKDCYHAELTPIGGSHMDAASAGAFANGKAWMDKHQLVEGGEGVLKAVNGGKEPTGRNPYCSVFKQVVTKIDQPGGKIQTSMYLRVCKRGIPDLGCTPYVIGPIPFLSYKEKQFIYLGDSNAKDDGGGINVGGNDDPLSSQDGFNDCGSKLSGAATDSAVKAVDRVAKSIDDGAMQVSSSEAKDDVERIMAEMQKQGINCPAQAAYILATAQRESTMGTNMSEFKDTAYQSSGGTQYYGRGYVQLTHKENYAKATQYLKSQGMDVDLVANPELASRKDIAAKLLVHGMKNGMFTGRRLNEYINCNGRVDFSNARDIVNPKEGGENRASIAKAAQIYYDALKDKDVAKDKASDTCNASGTPVQPCPPGQRCPLLNPLPHMSSAGVYSRYRRCRPNHNGVDIQSSESPGNYDRGMGTGGPVVAPDDGVVVYARNDGSGYANIVKIYHPQRGISTFMAHLSKITVSQGQQVKRGQQVGVEGGNGLYGPRSYGIHLHFEIHQGKAAAGNPYGASLDPEAFEYEKPAIRKPGADLFCGG